MAVRSLHTLATFALLAVVVLGASAGPGTVEASPPPTPVCPTCGVQFEEAADDAGVDVAVERSVVDVTVNADGSARWTTTTTLSADTAANVTPAELAPVVDDALDDHSLVDPRPAEIRLDGRTLTVAYAAPDVATTRLGVLLVDAFQRGPTRWWVVNADRFTVHAPDRHELANDPGGSTERASVTYTGDSQARYPGTSIAGDTFVAFTPSGTALPGVRADAAVAASLLPSALGDLVRYATVPTLVLAAAVLLYPRLGVASAGPTVDVERLAATTIGVVATLLGLLLAFDVVWFGVTTSATLLAVGFGLLATALAARYPRRTTLRGLLQAALAGLFAFAASNVLVVTLTTSYGLPGAIARTLPAVLLAVPAVGVLPLGFADAVDHGRGSYLRAALVVAPALFVATRVPTDGGMGSFFLLVALATYTVLVAVLGLLPYWIGTRVGTATR